MNTPSKLLRFSLLGTTGVIIIMSNIVMATASSDFCAYYTRLDYDIPLTQYVFDFDARPPDERAYDKAITDEYADIVVGFSDGKQLVFSRETSYRPYLKTADSTWAVAELVPRAHDVECLYSYARIIESTDEGILVHWRYMPDLSKVRAADVVHELFFITPDGGIRREVRQATPWVDEWKVAHQTLQLDATGIQELALEPLHLVKEQYRPVQGKPLQNDVIGTPVAWLRFDEGLEGNAPFTRDAMTPSMAAIGGHKRLWKAGISGAALAFDGYTSKVTLPSPEAPDYLDKELSVEAWVAVGAYPWDVTGIVQQSNPTDSRPKGYFLGIDDTGHPLLRVCVEGEWKNLVANRAVELYRWTHIAATFHGDKGEMAVYVDGESCGKLRNLHGSISASPTDILIGLNKVPGEATHHVSEKIGDVRTVEGSQPAIFGLEGLIDEVKVYNEALSDRKIAQSYRLLKPSEEFRSNPDLEKRILPGEVGVAEQFGAQHKTLRYHELWDNLFRTTEYGDIVVKFDESPVSIVYWRGTNYGANFVTDGNLWMADQSVEVETWCGCSEHMSDKECRFAHVRVIENSDARVVVHWRYASVGVMYNFPNNHAWTDEYHTIYPDGVVIRKVNYHAGDAGWNDTQFLAAPGQRPEDVMHLESVIAANMKGETYVLDWTNGIPENKLDDACIRWINFKSDYKVFVIYPGKEGLFTWGDRERGDGFGIWAGPWNHWPVAQLPNDGRFAVATDRLTHSALGGGDTEGNMALFGLTTQGAGELAPLARSWKAAPELVQAEGCISHGYQQAERSYHLSAEKTTMSFALQASEASPVVNPCFVVKNWGTKEGATLHMDGQALNPGSSFRQGIIRDTQGRPTLVIWLKTERMIPVRFELSRAERM
jgi:hypothetical protein